MSAIRKWLAVRLRILANTLDPNSLVLTVRVDPDQAEQAVADAMRKMADSVGPRMVDS